MNKKSFLKKLESFSFKIAREKHLLALRDGLILSMPLILIGSVFLIIAAFPIPAWGTYLKESGIGGNLWKIVDSTFGLMALIAVFGIAKRIAELEKADGIAAGIVAISSYILLIPFKDGGIKVFYFGSKGLFVAIIVALITGKLMAYLMNKNIVIKMPDTVPPAVSRSFAAIIPGFIVVSLFVVIGQVIAYFGTDIFSVVLKVLAEPLRGLSDSYLGTMVAVGLNSLFWIFGIHGGQMVSSIMNPVWLMNTDANRLAYQAGQELPHIVTQPFVNNFVWVGGAGATIGLAIFLFLFAKSKQYKALGKIAFWPDLFSVNEPMTFGIPIILNPNLVIPFFLTPIVTGTVAYFATYFGLVAKTVGIVIPWATPPIISGYLSTGGSISGPILQIVNIIISILIWYPFIKRLDIINVKEENKLEGEEKI